MRQLLSFKEDLTLKDYAYVVFGVLFVTVLSLFLRFLYISSYPTIAEGMDASARKQAIELVDELNDLIKSEQETQDKAHIQKIRLEAASTLEQLAKILDAQESVIALQAGLSTANASQDLVASIRAYLRIWEVSPSMEIPNIRLDQRKVE